MVYSRGQTIEVKSSVYMGDISKSVDIWLHLKTDIYMAIRILYTKFRVDHVTNMDYIAIISVNRLCVYTSYIKI